MTDWTLRTQALAYYEKAFKDAKRFNEEDMDMIEQAVNALRRSQEHTSIQTKLNSAVKVIRMIAEMPASTHDIDAALCREWLDADER